MASAQKHARLDNPEDDGPVANRTRLQVRRDWLRVFNGPALELIAMQLGKRSVCNLRLTCKMLARVDSLKAKCFGSLTLWILRHPRICNLCSYSSRSNIAKYVRLNEPASFESLERIASFVKEIELFKLEARLWNEQDLALIQPLPCLPHVWRLSWSCEGQEHSNLETLLALARRTPAAASVKLEPNWALIPGSFQLLSLWPQLKDVRIRGSLDERLAHLQTDPHTLLNAAASHGVVTELDLENVIPYDDGLMFHLQALLSNDASSPRVLSLDSGIVSSVDLTTLVRLNTLEKLALGAICDPSGNGVVSRDFLIALASVTTLKELTLAGRVTWSCTALDLTWSCTALNLVHFFRDAKFSLRRLCFGRCPFTAALPQAIADTQKYLEEVCFAHPHFAEGEPKSMDKTVLEKLPKIKKFEYVPCSNICGGLD